MSSKFDFSKFLFYAVSIAAALVLIFAAGFYSGVNKTFVYTAVMWMEKAVKETFWESPTLLKIRPEHFLQPAHYQGSGVTVNNVHDREEQVVFMSGFFNNTNELRLIRRNGDIVARWPVQFSKIFPNPTHLPEPPKTNWNVDTHGALALPDGSVVFNFEYSGLVKLDRCDRVVWTLARMTTHSVERAEGGGFWVPGRRYYPPAAPSPFPSFPTPFYEDTIMKVSEEGKVIKEISVPQLFYDNGMEPLLTIMALRGLQLMKLRGTPVAVELSHMNKIEELTRDMAVDFPMFKAGDLMLSDRQRNLIMVIDPDAGKVKWWRVGPWIRQHDPEFVPGGKIIVFNNNNYRTAFPTSDDITPISPPRYSNIMEYDFASDRYRIIYGDKPGQEFWSIVAGQVRRTSTGGLLITEFEGGRIFETDAEGRVVWEYINRYSPKEVSEITGARLYPASYFRVPDWSCERIGG